MTLDKAKEKEVLPFTWEISSITLPDLLGAFELSVEDNMDFNEVGFASDKLNDIEFAGPTITGQIDLDEGFQIITKASIPMKEKTEFSLILTKEAGETVKSAVVIDIKEQSSIRSGLDTFITHNDFISAFALITNIEGDCLIMAAKEEITVVYDDDLTNMMSKFITEYDTTEIPEGVHVRISVPMLGKGEIVLFATYLLEQSLIGTNL